MAQNSPKVNKSVSMSFDLMNAVLDESVVMGKDFSSTLTILVKMGLAQRRLEEQKLKAEIEEDVKRRLEQ